jgi:hypothetical protein
MNARQENPRVFISFFLLQMEERRTIGGGGKEFASSKMEAFIWQVN